MSLNLISLKKRDSNPVWLQIVDEKGEPLFYDDITLEEKQAFEKKLERFEKGELKKEPKLDCERKPVRIKLESPHSEAFRKAKQHRKIKDQIAAQGVLNAAQKEAEQTGGIDLDKILNDSTAKVCDSIDTGAKIIAELTLEWEGFRDPETLEDVPYNPELLADILSEPNNLATYTHIIQAIDSGEGFFTE